MAMCRICKQVDCDDDCEELALIATERKREMLKDIDISDMDNECACCGWPIDKGRSLCFYCENGLEDD